ncbi:MAG: anthranilate phosphoribosyltransferase [Actinomycetota bacterium]|nr:anthranilate phosphoribosyltransferase [Actinomycetota bacterium]MEC8648298.1 anthranilate phosphoribosyltransferase [Actinomycetota bacterium]
MTDSSWTWPTVLAAAMSETSVPPNGVAWAIDRILDDQATSAQIAAFVTALRVRGESPEQVRALVDSMMERAVLIDPEQRPSVVVDVVGTGGDGSNSVNISTMTALVVAAAGAPVIKHGNRAASSATGSADALEALGVRIELSAAAVATCTREVGIGFCFAPAFHPALRFAGPTRRELGVPTVFNIAGPLANPARPEAMLVGCARVESAPVMAQVLADRGVSVIVVRGDDGLDEISTTTTTRAWDATGAELQEVVLDPREWGIARVDPSLLVGGTAERNVELLEACLRPDDVSGGGHDAPRVAAIRDAVAVNAAAALVAFDAAVNHGADISTGNDTGSLSERIKAAIPRARTVLESGDAWALVSRWADASNRVADAAEN